MRRMLTLVILAMVISGALATTAAASQKPILVERSVGTMSQKPILVE